MMARGNRPPAADGACVLAASIQAIPHDHAKRGKLVPVSVFLIVIHIIDSVNLFCIFFIPQDKEPSPAQLLDFVSY
jgi:hypothetical protein